MPHRMPLDELIRRLEIHCDDPEFLARDYGVQMKSIECRLLRAGRNDLAAKVRRQMRARS